MARFARFLAAILCFPFVWALCLTFVDSFSLSSGSSQGLFSTEAISLFAGMFAFLAVWVALPAPVRLYVLGHELTHAVWGLAFGARVSNLRVRSTVGSVQRFAIAEGHHDLVSIKQSFLEKRSRGHQRLSVATRQSPAGHALAHRLLLTRMNVERIAQVGCHGHIGGVALVHQLTLAVAEPGPRGPVEA